LTADPSDAIGVFAYIIYKQQKIEFCKSFGGRELTKEELDSFNVIASLDTSIAVYRARGETLMRFFINAGLDELVESIEANTRKGVLYRRIESSNVALQEKLAAISETLRAKRTIIGWVRDVSGNLIVNLVSIFVLGALLLGYRFSAELQQGAERKAGVSDTTASQSQTTTAPAHSARSATTPDPPIP
jgi:methyl-accepting chemotaxis protein